MRQKMPSITRSDDDNIFTWSDSLITIHYVFNSNQFRKLAILFNNCKKNFNY